MVVSDVVGRLYGRSQRWFERVLLERRYGFPPESARDIELEEVGFAAEGREAYGPSPWRVLHRTLPEREVGSDDVFIDLGCGMGRVILEAAQYPFRRVIGVDVVPYFTAVASEMVERNRSRLTCGDIEVVTADVLDYTLPEDVTVAYLANPFAPEVVMRLVRRMIESVDRNPRRLRIVYLAPPERPWLDRLDRLELVRYGRRNLRRWADADYLVLYEIEPAPSPKAE